MDLTKISTPELQRELDKRKLEQKIELLKSGEDIHYKEIDSLLVEDAHKVAYYWVVVDDGCEGFDYLVVDTSQTLADADHAADLVAETLIEDMKEVGHSFEIRGYEMGRYSLTLLEV